MTKQVTITLSDGTPHTGTLDQDGFLLLPRGKKPAEPWWSRCEADSQGYSEQPDLSAPCTAVFACHMWTWSDDAWRRIRPLPSRTWESIAAAAKPVEPSQSSRSYHDVEVMYGGVRRRLFDMPHSIELTCTRVGGWQLFEHSDGASRLLAGEYSTTTLRVWVAGTLVCGPAPEPATPQQRDYTNWQEGLGDSAKPEDYDRCPEAYEVEYLTGGNVWRKILDPCWIAHATYRVRKRTKSPIDYTQWVEGYGSEAKPEDYDQQPGKYEVKWLDHRGYWFGFIENDTIRMWAPELVHRVRLRQSEPQGETDGEFALRFLVENTQRVTITSKDGYWASTGGSDWKVGHRDAIRLSRIIAEAKA